MNKNHPIAAWHALVQAKNPAQLDALLADEVVFHSPVVHTPQRGIDLTRQYLTAAMHVLSGDGFRYTREIVGDRDAMLEFETRIDGILINGVDLIHWNDAGKIDDFKVMVRPLKAVNMLHAKMASMLQTQR
jgi:hypothetical protein